MAAGISDGMSNGLERLKREIGRVRSPRVIPSPDSTLGMSGDLGSMTLEFDEDEDFVLTHSQKASSSAERGDDADDAVDADNDDAMSRSTSQNEGDESGASISSTVVWGLRTRGAECRSGMDGVSWGTLRRWKIRSSSTRSWV